MVESCSFARCPHLDDGEEVCVLHGLHGGEPLLVVVAQQLVQEVERLGAD